MNNILKHTIMVGLNDKDSHQQEIDTVDAYKITVRSTLKYYEGATITQGRGVYTHNDGTIVQENSLIISILFAEDKKTLALISDLKQMFNQESIALERQVITSELV